MKLNEIVAVPSNQNIIEKSNLHIQKLIFLLPLVLLVNNFSHEFTRKRNVVSGLGNDFIASIDIKSLNEKMDIIKKVGPYLPEYVVDPLNTIIFFIEKATTIIGLMEIITTNKSYAPIVALDNLTNKDRINGILSTIKDEANDEKVNTLKPVIDVILNFDRYKSLINMMSSLSNMNNRMDKVSNTLPKAEIPAQASSNNPIQIEDMANILKPLLGNDESKINQFNSMINVLKPMLESNSNKANQVENMVNATKTVLGNNENMSTEKIGDMFKMLELLNGLNSKEEKKE